MQDTGFLSLICLSSQLDSFEEPEMQTQQHIKFVGSQLPLFASTGGRGWRSNYGMVKFTQWIESEPILSVLVSATHSSSQRANTHSLCNTTPKTDMIVIRLSSFKWPTFCLQAIQFVCIETIQTRNIVSNVLFKVTPINCWGTSSVLAAFNLLWVALTGEKTSW